jgi:hypothetical protein
MTTGCPASLVRASTTRIRRRGNDLPDTHIVLRFRWPAASDGFSHSLPVPAGIEQQGDKCDVSTMKVRLKVARRLARPRLNRSQRAGVRRIGAAGALRNRPARGACLGHSGRKTSAGAGRAAMVRAIAALLGNATRSAAADLARGLGGYCGPAYPRRLVIAVPHTYPRCCLLALADVAS